MKTRTAEELYLNVYGGTLNRIIGDLTKQVEDIEEGMKGIRGAIRIQQKEDLDELLDLARIAVKVYLDCHFAGMQLEHYEYYDFVKKWMPEIMREHNLNKLGI